MITKTEISEKFLLFTLNRHFENIEPKQKSLKNKKLPVFSKKLSRVNLASEIYCQTEALHETLGQKIHSHHFSILYTA